MDAIPEQNHATLSHHDADIAALDKLTWAFFDAFTPKADGSVELSSIHPLFVEGGLIIKACGGQAEVYDLARFIAPREKLLNSGLWLQFKERPLVAKTEIFGCIAHRLLSYHKSWKADGNAVSARGMKSLQFICDEGGWKISSLVWDDEREGLQLPAAFQADAGSAPSEHG